MKKIYNNQKNCNIFSPIVVVANQPISLGSSGLIELRKESKIGEIIEIFDVTSNNLEILGPELIIKPTKPLPFETEIYVTITEGFIISLIGGETFSGFDVNGDKEFKFYTEKQTPGKIVNNYITISNLGGNTIVSTLGNSDFKGSWYGFNDIITSIEKDTNVTGWYIPSLFELQSHQNVLSSNGILGEYWTSTEYDAEYSFSINIDRNFHYPRKKEVITNIIAFNKIYF